MPDMDQEVSGDLITEPVSEPMSGQLTRRDFTRRAVAVGIAVPAFGAIVAACGDDEPAGTATGETDAPSETVAPGT
ncbi:MAG: hypothetical protein AAB131_07750, partial [Actinomycetota bacterium]